MNRLTLGIDTGGTYTDGVLLDPVEIAREKPIETILSGPAASIVGAAFLTGTEHALVLDMGGQLMI